MNLFLILLGLGLLISEKCGQKAEEEVGIGLELLIAVKGEGVKAKALIKGFESHVDDGCENRLLEVVGGRLMLEKVHYLLLFGEELVHLHFHLVEFLRLN